MEQHPLQYFKNLVFRNVVPNKRVKFLMSTEFSPVINRDFKNDLIEYAETNALDENSDVQIKVATFISYLENEINDEMFNALDLVDNALLSIDDEKKQSVYLKTLFKTLNSLILYSEGLEHLNKYIIIANALKDLKAELADRYNVQDDTVAQRQINIVTSPQTSHKLQWMGKSKVLITLFYDLYSNVENGGEPLIKATKDQIKNFLLNNFIEKDGQPFSASSIDSLLTPSKENKRALKDDRIDTSKLKEGK